MHILINKKYLTFDNYKAKCAIGKRGIGNKTKEGDLITPKGIYKVKYVLYRKDRVKKIKTKLKKVIIRKNMGWCDDPKSEFYNKLIKIEKSTNARHEKLFRKDNKYDIFILIKYNYKKILRNKGSAIFLHLTKNYAPTKGCIALKKKDFLILCRLIKKKTKIKIK